MPSIRRSKQIRISAYKRARFRRQRRRERKAAKMLRSLDRMVNTDAK